MTQLRATVHQDPASSDEDLVAELVSLNDRRQPLLRLRDAMRSHVWKTGATRIPLDRFVARRRSTTG